MFNGEGKDYREAFEADAERKWIILSGTLGKDNQIGIKEIDNAPPVPKPKPRNYKSWQADHVNDLGIYTTIANSEKPDRIDQDTWDTMKNAILGDVGNVCIEHVDVLR